MVCCFFHWGWHWTGFREVQMCIDGNKERGAEKKKRISDWTFFSTQWKLSVQAVVNITVEFSYNFNLCSLIVHVNVKLQERQNLLLAQRAKTKAQLLRRYQGESLLQNQCFFIHNFLFSKLPPLRLTGIQCCGVFRKMFIWNSSNKNMQQSRTTGSCFCSDTTERPSETGLFLNSRNGCLRILSQLISVLYRLQINTFIFVFSFFQYYNTVSFLISSESLTYWKSLSSCSSLKSDIRIMWHPRPCHLGNCWWSTFARFPSDTSQQTRPLSSNFGTCV